MKIKLFDGTVLNADVQETEDIIKITIPLTKVNEYSKIFESLTDSNLSAVTIQFEDGTHCEYSNLKFTSASLINKSGTYSVAILLSSKTAYELAVDGLTQEVNTHDQQIEENLTELTKTQLAIVELYETFIK